MNSKIDINEGQGIIQYEIDLQGIVLDKLSSLYLISSIP